MRTRDVLARVIGVAVIVLFFAAPWVWTTSPARSRVDFNGSVTEIETYSAAALATREASELHERGYAAPLRVFEPGSAVQTTIELELLLVFWATLVGGGALFVLAPRRFERARFAAALFALASAVTVAELAELVPSLLVRDSSRPPAFLGALFVSRATFVAAAFTIVSIFKARLATWLARVGAIAAVIDVITPSSQRHWNSSATSDWGAPAIVILLALCVWFLSPAPPKLTACDSAPTSS